MAFETERGEFAIEEESVFVTARPRPEPVASRPTTAASGRHPTTATDDRRPIAEQEHAEGLLVEPRREGAVVTRSGDVWRTPKERAEVLPMISAIERPAIVDERVPDGFVREAGMIVARPTSVEDRVPRRFESRDEARLAPSKEEPALLPVPRRPDVPPLEKRDWTDGSRRSSLEAPRGADEIHINIGRVEVAAAALPPRAAGPARKTPSLEDYLRDVRARRR
jgi:hypothetical protein